MKGGEERAGVAIQCLAGDAHFNLHILAVGRACIHGGIDARFEGIVSFEGGNGTVDRLLLQHGEKSALNDGIQIIDCPFFDSGFVRRRRDIFAGDVG